MNSRLMPTELNAITRLRPNRRAVDEADSVDLRGLLRMVWRRRWLLVAAVLGLGLLTYFLTSAITPTYTSLSKVKLDERRPDVGDEVLSSLDLSEQVVNGEAAVLRSNVLLEQVIDQIGFDALSPLVALPRMRDRAIAMPWSGPSDAI